MIKFKNTFRSLFILIMIGIFTSTLQASGLLTANAGADINYTVTASNRAVHLVGTATPNDNIVKYEWFNGTTFIGTGASRWYVLTEDGTHTLTLKVTDAEGNIATDTMVVNVNHQNTTNTGTLTANAGADITHNVTASNRQIYLNGTTTVGSSPIVKQEWFKDGVKVWNGSLAWYTLVTPGDYNFEFRVTAKDGSVASDTMIVTVINELGNSQTPPTANAGADQSIVLQDNGTLVQLDGSGSSDPDGDTLTYNWSFISQPTGSEATLDDYNSKNPSFTATIAGDYTLQLIVNDGQTDSILDSVTVTILGTESISGVFTNAINGQPIANIALNIREGADNHLGNILQSTSTNSNGHYLISLVDGIYTIEASHNGYINGYFTIEVTGDSSNNQHNYALSPLLQNGETRIVLTWSETPHDLDSHLTGPNDNNNTFHVFYGHQTDSGVALDHDDVTSYGPETITITTQYTGEYFYYVYNFSRNSLSGLSNSQAKVEIYRNNNLIKHYTVPLDQDGYYWNVFTLNDSNINDINTISNSPSTN